MRTDESGGGAVVQIDLLGPSSPVASVADQLPERVALDVRHVLHAVLPRRHTHHVDRQAPALSEDALRLVHERHRLDQVARIIVEEDGSRGAGDRRVGCTERAITLKWDACGHLRRRERLLERLPDEDEADERGEALLREPGDVAHERGNVKSNEHNEDKRGPKADPEPEAQKIELVVTIQVTDINE